MSLVFTPTDYKVKGGHTHIYGTCAFSASADPGEEVSASDVDAGLQTLSHLSITPSGNNQFEFVSERPDGGIVKVIDASGGSGSKVTGISVTGLFFHAIGQFNFA